MANKLPYYKSYPRDFVEDTIGWPFEIKCAYRVVLDLIYMQGGKLPDDARYISGHLGCSLRKWKSIRQDLIARGKLHVSTEFLTNNRADKELETLAKLQDIQRENASGPRVSKGLAKPRHSQPEPEPEPEPEPKEVDKSTSTQEVEAYQNYLKIHPKPVESVAGERAWCALIEAGEDPQVIIGAARAYAKAVQSWSAEGKVQRSDNFLAPERGKWREYRSQTDKSEVAAMTRDAKRIREHDAATAGPIKFHPEIAKILISKQFITTQEAKEAGIQI